MDSMPLILARVTVSGLAIINFLLLWLFVKQDSNGVQRRRMRRHAIFLPVEVDGKKGVRWVGKKDFGLQFISIPFRERARLGELLQWVA